MAAEITGRDSTDGGTMTAIEGRKMFPAREAVFLTGLTPPTAAMLQTGASPKETAKAYAEIDYHLLKGPNGYLQG
jgi:hypothetical protein